MNKNDQELAHRIKIKFGTSPNEPSEYQIQQIKVAIQTLVSKGVSLPQISQNDFATIVKKYCPSVGSHSYSGADASDLITLLQMATKTGK